MKSCGIWWKTARLNPRRADAGSRIVGSKNVSLTGDPELIRRATENVLRNAIRYSPEGATVDVEVGTDSGFAKVRIATR